MEGMPLPIVTNGSSNHGERNTQTGGNTPSSQLAPGEYSPFNNGLFTNFLTKKDDLADKKDFASVAAAGVVTTSPASPQTTSNPVQAPNNAIIAIDPALQAKAPGYKIPQRGNSPPYRSDTQSMIGYQMTPVGCGVTNSVQGVASLNNGMNPGALVSPFVDDYNMNPMLQCQYLNQQVRDSFNPMLPTALFRMEMGADLPLSPGVFHQGMSGILMSPGQQQQLPQKEEYSKPHRPMTLPEIKGGLNPNAPEFQLPNNGPLMMNGFDRLTSNILGGVPGMTIADANGRPPMGPVANMEGSTSNPSQNPSLASLTAGTY